MHNLFVALAVGVVAFAAVGWLALAGSRHGDRPGDAPVRAALRSSGQADEKRPVAVVAVRNPGRAALLVAVSVRPARLPAWLAGAVSVAVPRRTTRPRYRPEGFPTVAVVDGGQRAELPAPVPAAARRYLVTVLVGQSGARLRVHRLRVDGTAVGASAGRVAVADC